MFKAINSQSGEEIIILQPRWVGQTAYLRSLDKKDILICQECRQPVRVRAGPIRRWHFAHKHLQNCPLDRESPALLKTRAIIYEWLVSKFGESVTLEKKCGERLPRSVDCWVERESGSFAYWIIESRIKPAERENLKTVLAQIAASTNWVFVSNMLHEDEDKPDHILLTTTEREFMQSSEYDEMIQATPFTPGHSLHYLDPANQVLTTFRGLHLIHEPQLYGGHKEMHEIALVLVSPKTGEFVHPGEPERLQNYRQEKQRLEERRREEQRRALERQIAISQKQDSETQQGYATSYVREATCMICGNKTTSWWYFNGRTGMCKCKDCRREGKT